MIEIRPAIFTVVEICRETEGWELAPMTAKGEYNWHRFVVDYLHVRTMYNKEEH
jgi:hypothetical protein